jgi:hypothetical protein
MDCCLNSKKVSIFCNLRFDSEPEKCSGVILSEDNLMDQKMVSLKPVNTLTWNILLNCLA